MPHDWQVSQVIILIMNKCQHGEKITTFCATDSCQAKQAAGCELCIKKYHSHLVHCSYLSEEEVHALMRKFTVDNSVKPKCRQLQESIYNYFTQIKTELVNSLDTACKNMINQIGYPYLFVTNTLPTFKRLKNKQYKKIAQKQFKHFFEVVNKIEEKEIAKEQIKIYQVEMKNTNELLSQLEGIIKNYENIVKVYHNNFVHQTQHFQKINDIIKSIGSQSPLRNQKKGIEIKEIDHPDFKYSKDMPKINIINTPIANHQGFTLNVRQDSRFDIRSTIDKQKLQKNDKTEDIDPKTLNPSILPLPKMQRTRDVSLDKKVLAKEGKINLNEQQKSKDGQKSESKLHNHKIESLKQELNNRQLEINQKKRLLLDIMKPSQKIERPLQKLQSIMVGSPLKAKNSQIQGKSKRQHLTTDLSANGSKSSKSSEDLSAIEDQSSKITETTKNYAFAKLPIEEPSPKKEEKLEVKKKLIIIPTEAKGLNGNKATELDSPLYKKRRIESINQDKTKEEVNNKTESLRKKTEPDPKSKQPLELKENQEKSLALLMKSLTMSAENAIVYLEASLKYAENNLSAAQYLSYLYLELNRPKDCLALCNKVLDKIESSHESQTISINIVNNKAAALNILGRYSEAIMIIERTLKCKQKDTLFKNLGDSYYSIGIYQKAIYNFQKSLRLNSNNDECHYNLAVCLYLQQNFVNSKLSIKKALEIQPKHELYLQLLGKIDEKIQSI